MRINSPFPILVFLVSAICQNCKVSLTACIHYVISHLSQGPHFNFLFQFSLFEYEQLLHFLSDKRTDSERQRAHLNSYRCHHIHSTPTNPSTQFSTHGSSLRVGTSLGIATTGPSQVWFYHTSLSPSTTVVYS